ncbi:MAG: hypothetical protein QNI87_07295 [Erythrobacter sp.]|uniref:hypothetical protein n=1 Tax=Erythrobacter sp. TaxID=1042 RepID=UPI00261F4E9E|nr:hypothetical protein [Erythrobacter sp.]MDJ0978325.1 hypothetical protein [Erythrobacter sp.]
MRRAVALATALAAASASAASGNESSVELIVEGPPIEAKATGQDHIYPRPSVPGPYRSSSSAAGILAQGWSMLGREDLAAAAGSNEYRARPCEALAGGASGAQEVLDVIAARAANARIVIINESHEVTLHRDFSRRVIERLRPLGYSVFAAETFANLKDKTDPVEESAALPYPRARDGHYLLEPVFGELVRSAKRLGFRLAAYEQAWVPEAERPTDMNELTAAREQEQAENLVAILRALGPDEKLLVHAGYWHANESGKRGANGTDRSYMAARLKRITGLDPLTIAQTECRGSADTVRLSAPGDRIKGAFDILVDHPIHGFRHGRSDWRFADGAKLIGIPEPYASADETLIIEAFAENEPFESVPVDRVWVEPGEDVKLALKPGRYRVRAVRPVILRPAGSPTTPG